MTIRRWRAMLRRSGRVRTAVLAGMSLGITGLVVPAAGATTTVTPSADAMVVFDQPNSIFGAGTEISSDRSPSTEGLIAFDVAGLTAEVTRATLRLYVTSGTSDGPEIWRSESGWTETVTWNTRPGRPLDGRLADLGSASSGRYVDIDVKAAISGNGAVSFALVPDSTDGFDFYSREASSNRPQLVIETTADTPPPPPPPPPGGDGTHFPTDDASVADGGGSMGSDHVVVSDRSPMTEGYIRFNLGDVEEAVTRAVLRVFITSSSSNGPQVWSTATTWSEGTVTWGSRPARQGSVIRDLGSVGSRSWLEIDVTPAVAAAATGNGTVSFVFVPDSTDGLDFTSKEASVDRPHLVVTTGEEEEPPPPPPGGGAFDFGAIGDTGYSSSQVTAIADLRREMNAADIAFTIHDGDIKSGTSSCSSNSLYTGMRDRWNLFDHPFIYTPGDNEWTDCSDPEGRLSFLRDVFYPTDRSMGSQPMTLDRQSDDFPENARWHHGGVTFATLHTVGFDNNVDDSSEFDPRNEANLAWLEDTFDVARSRGSIAVVFATQANPGWPSGKTGFSDLIDALESETAAWGKPVLFIHGDTHSFTVNQPLRFNGSTLRNFTRLETYATSDRHWVRVTVDPSDPGIFRFDTEDY